MKDPPHISHAIEEQRRYYEARAPEYDEWRNREGRYALDEYLRKRWNEAIGEVRHHLAKELRGSSVLEIAAGTGFWTQALARLCTDIVAVDGSRASLALNRARLGQTQHQSQVRLVHADLFSWSPDRSFDHVFASFWFSHVPFTKLQSQLELCRDSITSGGRILILDAQDGGLRSEQQGTRRVSDELEVRELNDGTTFQIIKRYYQPDELAERINALGFTSRIRRVKDQFFFLVAERN